MSKTPVPASDKSLHRCEISQQRWSRLAVRWGGKRFFSVLGNPIESRGWLWYNAGENLPPAGRALPRRNHHRPSSARVLTLRAPDSL